MPSLRGRVAPGLLLVGAAAVLCACAGSTPRSRSTGTDSTSTGRSAGGGPVTLSSGQAHEFAIHDGDLVRGMGDVVAVPGEPVRFCSQDVAIIESTPFDACPVGVPVTGANLTALADRRTRNGVVRGSAQITGIFHDRTITVRTQVARKPASSNRYSPTQQVPCDQPPGGWPEGRAAAMTAAYRYKRDHPDAIVQLAILHPDVSSDVVYVLTTGNPDPVRAALAAVYGDRLCVQRSAYSARQLAAARAVANRLITHPTDPLTSPTGGAGIGLGPSLQVDTALEVGMIDDRLARVVDAQPAGLIEIYPWLVPLS